MTVYSDPADLEGIYPGVKFYGPVSIGKNVKIGRGTGIGEWVKISDRCRIGMNCSIFYHASLSKDVVLEHHVFIGPGVRFSNDKYPPTKTSRGAKVGAYAVIGLNASIGAGVQIGERAVVGMGAVVTEDVAPGTVVAGNPARPIGTRAEYGEKQKQWVYGETGSDARRS